MQDILESTSKPSSMRVLFWRLFLTTFILLLSHTPGFAQDSGASTATSYSPMTTEERWSQYLNDNFAKSGTLFSRLFARLWGTRRRISPRNGADQLNAIP